MPQKMKITISIEDEDGQEVINSTSERGLPTLREFEAQGFRPSINQIDRAVLEARKEVTDKAIEGYLEEISKKKTNEKLEEYPEGKTSEGFRDYGLDMEFGSIDITTQVIYSRKDAHTIYSVADELFEKKPPMERIRAAGYEELLLDFSTDMSYRNAAKRLNRIRHEPDGISGRTARNIVENQGKAILNVIKLKDEAVFESNGFTKTGRPPKEPGIEKNAFTPIAEEEVKIAAAELGIGGDIDFTSYESEENTVNVSMDDVLSKKQAANRPDSPEKGQRKYVSNTVIHVHKEVPRQLIVAGTIAAAMKQLIALVLSAGLVRDNCFVFFTDGAEALHDAIKKMFTFQTYKIILDWHHIEDKLKQRLSSACQNSKIRNEQFDKIRPFLWYGNVEGAMRYLESIPEEMLKAPEYIVKLIEYLQRNRTYIPCYALRAKLGLRNSSNRGEKANDMVVSHRQKHDGMSWCKSGSLGLAVVTATCLNGDLINWVHKRDVGLELRSRKPAV